MHLNPTSAPMILVCVSSSLVKHICSLLLICIWPHKAFKYDVEFLETMTPVSESVEGYWKSTGVGPDQVGINGGKHSGTYVHTCTKQ